MQHVPSHHAAVVGAPQRRTSIWSRAALPGRWRRWQLPALAAVTAYSTALGWQAQQVSYPLFRAVAPGDFAAYHDQYNQAIPWVVIVPGFVGFVAATAFWWTRPSDVPRPVAALVSLTGLTCLITTVAWAVPMHDRLDAIGQSSATIDSLLQANLVRTLALTASTVALTWCLGRSRPGVVAAKQV
jgi:hypothetical protein